MKWKGEYSIDAACINNELKGKEQSFKEVEYALGRKDSSLPIAGPDFQ